MININYTWAMIDIDCNTLATMTQTYLEKTSRVIALHNDLVPATLIAARLNLPVIQITDINNPPLISEPLVSGDGTMSAPPSLIFVVSRVTSDVCDELNILSKKYKSAGHNSINIIALFATQNNLNPRQIYQTFVSDDTNITFPWNF